MQGWFPMAKDCLYWFLLKNLFVGGAAGFLFLYIAVTASLNLLILYIVLEQSCKFTVLIERNAFPGGEKK